jgi:hypothetical protein
MLACPNAPRTAKLMDEYVVETLGALPPEALGRVALAIGEAFVPDDDS